MIRHEEDGLEWLQFEILADLQNVKHGSFLRHGGESTGEFACLNMSYSVGDQEENVTKNRQRAKDVFDLPKLVYSKLCHSKDVWEVNHESVSLSRKSDALTTSCRNLGLLITHADCQCAIIYDPIHHAVANVHSGWRGSVQNIYASTIAFMKGKYGSSPEDLLVGITPSLGPDKAEFIHYRQELPEPFWEFQTKDNHFDFWEVSRWQLEQCGVLLHHIEIAKICTCSNPKDYFSYRHSKVTGRLGTIVAIV